MDGVVRFRERPLHQYGNLAKSDPSSQKQGYRCLVRSIEHRWCRPPCPSFS